MINRIYYQRSLYKLRTSHVFVLRTATKQGVDTEGVARPARRFCPPCSPRIFNLKDSLTRNSQHIYVSSTPISDLIIVFLSTMGLYLYL